MATVRDYEIQHALTTKAQTAYGTARAEADLTLAFRQTAFNAMEFQPVVQDDREAYGNGHAFATEQKIERYDTKGKIEGDLQSELAGLLAAFALGSVTSAQQDTTSAYEHVIKPMALTTAKQLPVTTMAQKLSSGFSKLYRDMVISQLMISCGIGERAKISADLIGSGHVADVSSVTYPAPTDAPYLRSDDLKIELGTNGSEADISLDATNFEMTWNNDILADPGYCYDGGGYRRKAEIGKPELSLKFGVRAPHDADTEFDRLMNQTELSLIASFISATEVDTGYYHTVKIEVPKLLYKAAPINADGKIVGYSIEATPLYDSSISAPFQMTIINSTTEYLATT